MTDDLIIRAAAVEAARRHRSKIEVNEPLWHEGQDWASDRIAEALAALPAAQEQAEPVAITGKHFRKKPVVIEAVQWGGSNLDEVMAFCAGNATYELMARGNSELIISTLEDGEGTAQHVASRGDWIIRGVQGEYYPCKPDIFTATYENAYPTSPAPDDLDALVQRLRAPAYWMSGSGEGHEGENNAPREAADAITALRARPATVQVKPLVWEAEGPQVARWTCKGCRHFRSEYWREPDGEGEWDSGTSADCLLLGKSICTYSGSAPMPPDWCPKPRAALVASEPAPGSHQRPLPSWDAQGDAVDRATANRLIADLQAKLDAANADAERLAEVVKRHVAMGNGVLQYDSRPALDAHAARKGGA